MKFSSNPRRLNDQVLDLIWKCNASRSNRDGFYTECKDYYTKGGTQMDAGPANKIKPIVNRQSSFLYAPESTKFWVDPPPEEDNEEVYKQTDAVSAAIAMAWSDTGIDDKFSTAVTWSRVRGTTIMTILPRMRSDGKIELKAYDINPRYFGVLREDVPELEDQQAVTLTSYYPREELEARFLYHPKRRELMTRLDSTSKDAGSSGEDVIIMGPNASRYQAEYWRRANNPYRPQIPFTLYAIHDLYAFDDDIGDWRVFTVTGEFIIWDRPIRRIGIPGMLPFIKVCAEPDPEYFWGISLVDDLRRLQDWHSDLTADMNQLIKKILDPPTAGIGVGQSIEGKLQAFHQPGGRIALPNAASSLQQFETKMPPEVFEFMQGVDNLFVDSSGMRSSMFGKQEPGTRTEGMAAGLMRLAGAEMRLMGLRVERQAQSVAELLFQYLRIYSRDKLVDEDGKLFLMAQFPDDAKVRVDGHSTSPLFVEDNAQMAMGLIRYGAITPSTLIKMLHPALEGKMLHDLRKIEFAKLVAQEKIKAEQEMKRSGKSAVSG